MTRITPLDPPYEPEVLAQLEAMMPPGVPPIALFRTFVRNLPMAEAMRGWGRYELGRDLSLSLREREIVIDRTCARCRCEYEWAVHVAFFAERAMLTTHQLTSLTSGEPADPCWTSPRERTLIQVVDALHDHSTIDDELATTVAEHFTDAEALDVYVLCGWYHAISFAANAAAVPLEPGTPHFADVG